MTDAALGALQQTTTVRLSTFNQLDPEAAKDLLRPCLDVERWLTGLAEGRAYDDLDELFTAARTIADPFTAAELEAALSHHPRIGQRAAGDSAEAELSRGEQAGLAVDSVVEQRLAAGNRAYEQQFGRVFLIRAAGRSSQEILASLEHRLGNTVDTEDLVVGEQLRQIALIRLAARVVA